MIDLQAAHRSLVGNACLYRDLALKPRPFLRRNLNQVLDAHARSLEHQSRSADDLHVPRAEPIPEQQSTASWLSDLTDLSKGMLQELIRGLKPVLRVDALQLRPLARDDAVWRHCEPEPGEPEIDFLPASSKDGSWKCLVLVDILDGEVNANTRQAVVTHQRVEGTLSEWNDQDGTLIFEVALERPFDFALDKYFMGTQSDSNDGRYWNHVVDRNYTMEVALSFPSLRDAQEVISHIEGHDIGEITRSKDGVIRAIWSGLPTCPPAGQLLPTKRHPNRTKITDLRYGMDVSMGWSRKRDSPLQQYNRLRLATTQQMPTPSSSMASEPSPTHHSIRYVFQEGLQTRVCIIKDLRCIFCRDQYFASSLLHLRHHYIVNHEYFHFELQQTTAEHPGSEHQTAIFLMTRAEQGSCSPDTDEARSTAGYSRVAPDEPYDIATHLAGDDSWSRFGVGEWPNPDAPRKKATNDLGKRQKPAKAATPLRGPPRAPPPQSTSPGEHLELDDVADIPDTHRPQRSLPTVAEGVVLYHSITRQPIQPGDYLSESDDEPEDRRLTRSQRQKFSEAGLTPAQRSFHEAFNGYLDTIPSESKSYVKNGHFLRFFKKRKHQDRWKDPEQQAELRKKMAHMREHDMLTEETERYCLSKFPECVAKEKEGSAQAPPRKRKNRAHPSCGHEEQTTATSGGSSRKADMKTGRGRSETTTDDDGTRVGQRASTHSVTDSLPATVGSSSRSNELSSTSPTAPVRDDV